MYKTILTALIAGFSLTAPAWAHEGEHHEDHTHAAPHGGVVSTVQQFHFELVSKGNQIKVYLLDDKLKLLPTKGRTGEAIVQMNGKTHRIVLKPNGEAFTGQLDLSKATKYVAVISLRIDGKMYRGRFSQPSHAL
ncbi:MAG: hypothetical protein H7338_16630 [Candidatus Sericytochromatia bacterium]|nr:hypothetical protein [Candidatus Sericytochromatia bacterium]